MIEFIPPYLSVKTASASLTFFTQPNISYDLLKKVSAILIMGSNSSGMLIDVKSFSICCFNSSCKSQIMFILYAKTFIN